MQHNNGTEGSETLARQVRAALVGSGDSLRAWCLRNGVSPSYAHRVLRGEKDGPAAQEMRTRLLAETTNRAA